MDGSTGRLKSALPSLAAGMRSVVAGDGLTKGSLRRKGRGLVRGPGQGPKEEGRVARGEKGVLFVTAAALRSVIVLRRDENACTACPTNTRPLLFCLPILFFSPHPNFRLQKTITNFLTN